MRVDRDKLKLFIRDLRITEAADQVKLSDSELIEEIARYFENNTDAIHFSLKKPNLTWDDESEKEPFNYD
jgi:septum formation topological specificity factor MinE